MDVSHLLDHLNDHQREAVSTDNGCNLVLAGAGSGKTRVLVHRIAWLTQVLNISPYAVMAVTFTNKAAAELRGRIEELVGSSIRGMWTGTFHGIAHRILRAHYMDAGLPENFQILDSDDQYRIIRRVLKSMNLDEKHWPPKQAQWYINSNKDEGLRPQHIDTYGDSSAEKMRQIYQNYQEACDRAGLVDFAELLLRAHELWLNKPLILRHYQQRFSHILVDEFQDTNNIQYAWLKILAGESGNLMIVGDDDQSIYGWRGAQVGNIQRYLDDFPRAGTIRLEQNYRSTSTILKAANQLIANNADRLGKDLWTEGDDGEPISLYQAFNELDEARFIVARIKEWQDQGNNLQEAAILYRSNAQSRVLEEALLQEVLPYRIYGGLRFFERQEIKDALGYLRLINNRQDDAAFERVVNTPARGIGDRTLLQIRDAARALNLTLWYAAQQLVNEKQLSGRAANALRSFFELVDNMDKDVADLPLFEQSEHVIKTSGLYAMYQQEKGEKAQARIENLEELVTATRQFVVPEEAEELTPLTAFLTHASLEAGENQAETHQDAVQMMTMHSAKGLEFPLVFIAGVEEGMFPSKMSMDESGRLEEERRLCYVAMTRAMKKLFISYAESRRLYGQESYNSPSRFIGEIPSQYVEEIRLRTTVTRAPSYGRFSADAKQESFSQSGFQLGQRVSHSKFGEGTVINYEGAGESSRIQVNFEAVGSKWLVTSYANLQKL
jgi:DNA helicase-2/ATP-dependent DNA helicase PcrA